MQKLYCSDPDATQGTSCVKNEEGNIAMVPFTDDGDTDNQTQGIPVLSINSNYFIMRGCCKVTVEGYKFKFKLMVVLLSVTKYLTLSHADESLKFFLFIYIHCRQPKF